MDTDKPELIRLDIHLLMRAWHLAPEVREWSPATLWTGPVRLPPHFGLPRHDRA